MTLDLRQRLSEFSYGYGVTREIQLNLQSVGLHTVPFLPSLLHEAEIGCDVHFDRPGIPLLIQFKLGHELKKFRRNDKSKPAPILDRPYWRFTVDTAEKDGQYDILLKSERSGAEFYYAAPRFGDWNLYASAFQSDRVLENSLLMPPSEIDEKLRAAREPDGPHKIAYDTSRVYVCSEPRQVRETRIAAIANNLKLAVRERGEPIASALKRVFDGFNQRRDIRSAPIEEPATGDDSFATVPRERIGRSHEQIVRERSDLLKTLSTRASSDEAAVFAALGIETWAAGSQLFAVTER